MATLDRRNLLAGGAALPSLALSASACAALPNADPLIELGRELAAELPTITSIYVELETADQKVMTEEQIAVLEEKYDAAFERLDALWEKMRAKRSTSIEGLKVKARLAHWHMKVRGSTVDPQEIGLNLIEDIAAMDVRVRGLS